MPKNQKMKDVCTKLKEKFIKHNSTQVYKLQSVVRRKFGRNYEQNIYNEPYQD